MPCRTYDDYDSYASVTQDKLDKVTRLLCGVMKSMGEGSVFRATLLKDNKELREWWTEHQEQDRRRLEAEAAAKKKKELKKQALSKLSPEEKKALGI